MRRWDRVRNAEAEISKIDDFIAEIKEVCRKHDMVIEHEDSHGAFIVRRGFSYPAFGWLESAHIGGES